MIKPRPSQLHIFIYSLGMKGAIVQPTKPHHVPSPLRRPLSDQKMPIARSRYLRLVNRCRHGWYPSQRKDAPRNIGPSVLEGNHPANNAQAFLEKIWMSLMWILKNIASDGRRSDVAPCFAISVGSDHYETFVKRDALNSTHLFRNIYFYLTYCEEWLSRNSQTWGNKRIAGTQIELSGLAKIREKFLTFIKDI